MTSNESPMYHEEPIDRVKQGYVSLPFNETQFGKFIQSLLGNPQSISKIIRGSFVIQVDDLRNLHHLITQRVNQQNNGVLVQFTAKIIFSDNSSVGLNNIEDLLSYNEVKPIISTAIHLQWDFLVKFRDKNEPEMQRINVTFVSSIEENTSIIENIIFDEEYPYSIKDLRGAIIFRIEHTARTWGADIEALLDNQIKSLIKPESKLKIFLRKHDGTIALTVFLLFILASLAVSYVVTKKFATSKVKAFTEYINNQNSLGLDTLNNNLTYLAQFIVNGSWSQHYFNVAVFIIISIFLAIWLGAWVLNTSYTFEPSFILLTKESINHKNTVLKKLRRKWLSYIFSIVTSTM